MIGTNNRARNGAISAAPGPPRAQASKRNPSSRTAPTADQERSDFLPNDHDESAHPPIHPSGRTNRRCRVADKTYQIREVPGRQGGALTTGEGPSPQPQPHRAIRRVGGGGGGGGAGGDDGVGAGRRSWMGRRSSWRIWGRGGRGGWSLGRAGEMIRVIPSAAQLCTAG